VSASSFFADYCPFCHHFIEVATEAQQKAFQLVCLDLAERADWPPGSGLRIDAGRWKQLLMLAWFRAHGVVDGEILPSIDGIGFDVVYKRPERLPKIHMSELLSFADAWCADKGIVRSRSRRERQAEQF
jgi:NinB protein